MKKMSSKGVRSGRLACSSVLITSLLIILFCHCYNRSYAMQVESTGAESIETTNTSDITITDENTHTFENTAMLSSLAECTTITIEEENVVLAGNQEQDAEVNKTVVSKTIHEIPSSFVHPVSGKTVSYKGGKTIERSRKITYGVSGYINALASPDEDGFMKLDNRYLIAVGSKFNTVPGQYIDLILANGVTIKCIMGDEKADADTDATNTFTYRSRCCSEFIIDDKTIRKDIYERGNASLKYFAWDSPVVRVVVYDAYHDYYEL